MENQHRKIKGYRELSQAEIDLMNEVKETGVKLQELFQKINMQLERQYNLADEEERKRIVQAEPTKWLGWAKDTSQVVLMQTVRAIAQPSTF